jgi:DNA-binding NarL/FixJ family response regulator
VPNPRCKYFHASGPGIEELVEKMRAFEANEKTITLREQEVLRLISQGILVKEVAYQLSISKSTLEKILQNMCKKFEVKCSKELIAFGLKNQLV